MYSTYKDIVPAIERTLKRLNLSPLEKPPEYFIEKELRFYYTLCENEKGEKVFFKSSLKEDQKAKERFLNEINLLKTIRENNHHPLFRVVPFLLDYSLDPSFPFLSYRFLPGKAKTREDSFSEKELKKIIAVIKIINSSENIFEFIPAAPFFTFDSYRERTFSLIEKSKLEKGIEERTKLLVNESREVFEKTEPALTHGDFSEANVIFGEKGLKIIDWEHVNVRNPFYDLASFWVKRKKSPKETHYLKREYLKEGKPRFFDALFKLARIEIILCDLLFFEETLKILARSKRKDKAVEDAKKDRRVEIEETLSLLGKII